MADLIIACTFVEFARCHLELLTNGLQATQRLTHNSNSLVISLEFAGTMWEATGFIAKIRKDYAIDPASIERESARRLFVECGKQKPSHAGLQRLKKIRDNASSHFNRDAAHKALEDNFDLLTASPLLISEDGTPHRTVMPVAIKVLMLYCYGDAPCDETLEEAQQQVSEVCADTLNVLVHIQDFLSEGLQQYMRRSREGDRVTLPWPR